jgi:hypothetical protein
MLVEDPAEGNYDHTVVKIGLEWLTQYARFLRRSPELLKSFDDRPGEFESIPIPKVLLERLAVPGMVGSGTLGGVDSQARRLLEFDLEAISQHAKAPPADELFGVVRAFATAVDAGDAARAGLLFSPGFIDSDGKSGAEVQCVLNLLFGRTSNRRFRVSTIAQALASETEGVLHVNAHWQASAVGADAEEISERIKLEIVVERQPDAAWRISGLRSL